MICRVVAPTLLQEQVIQPKPELCYVAWTLQLDETVSARLEAELALRVGADAGHMRRHKGRLLSFATYALEMALISHS
jgi:hypothetical protein